MKPKVAIGLVAAALAAPSAAHARLLVDANDLRVSTVREVICGTTPHLAIEADEPRLLSASSPRVQGVFDAARAMLEFECGPLPAAEVTGRLRGLSQASYQVRVSADTNWLLAPDSVSARPDDTPGPTSRFEVRSLTTGIGVDDAMERVRREFGTEPLYDPARRELTAARNADCADSRRTPLQPGAQCLTARFTETAQPRLSRLYYTQAVDSDQAERIRRQLIEIFGDPAVDTPLQRADAPTRQLAWGEPVIVNRRGLRVERHELRARIRVQDDVTIVRLNLVDPAIGDDDSLDGPAHQAQF